MFYAYFSRVGIANILDKIQEKHGLLTFDQFLGLKKIHIAEDKKV